MAVPALRRSMLRVAARLEMPPGYARALWIIGTIVAWPAGLYVLLTGRLVLPGSEPEPRIARPADTSEQAAPGERATQSRSLSDRAHEQVV
jgi:hypothetical protein